MNTPKRLCWVDQPWVVIGSLLLSLWFAQIWVRCARQLQPPSLPNGSWRGQPPTILVRFRGLGGCRCEVSLREGYTLCQKRGVPYILVADETTLSHYDLSRRDFPQARCFSETDTSFVLPLTTGKSETLLIVDGSVRKRWAGVSITKGMLTP